MATCKDCLHVEVCLSYLSTVYSKRKLATPDFELLQNIECNECQHFKDRSKFVDMTDIKQNVIRPLCNRCAALTDCQTCLACALEIRKHCNHYKQAEQALNEKEKKENE